MKEINIAISLYSNITLMFYSDIAQGNITINIILWLNC
jgi:hypothetical protein